MKRIVSVLLVAILIVTCLATVAFAAGSATVSANSVNAKANEEVTITYTVSGAFANYEMTLTHDPALTLIAIGPEVVSNAATKFVNWANGENVESHSFTAVFKVSPDAAAGSYPVSASVGFISDRNLVDQEYTVIPGAVIVEDPKCTHEWDDGVVTIEATCSSEGVMTYTCKLCGETETKVIAMKDHTWSNTWSFDDNNHWHKCSVCSAKKDEAAHIWHWVVDRKAGNQPGLKHEECEICLHERNKNTVIPAVPGLDPVPGTGDITMDIIFGVAGVLAMLTAAAYVFKRKTAK